MGNVIPLPKRDHGGKRPENMYFCTRCECDQFYFWDDGVVMCSNCCLEIDNLRVVPK